MNYRVGIRKLSTQTFYNDSTPAAAKDTQLRPLVFPVEQVESTLLLCQNFCLGLVAIIICALC